MEREELAQLGKKVIEATPIVILSTIGEVGFPESRAMLNLPLNKIDDIFFTTNTSSRKIAQIQASGKASAYFCLPDQFQGLLVTGMIAIVDDMKTKKKIWQKNWEMYYPKGVEDPDYAILHLKPQVAHYYHNLEKHTVKL